MDNFSESESITDIELNTQSEPESSSSGTSPNSDGEMSDNSRQMDQIILMD